MGKIYFKALYILLFTLGLSVTHTSVFAANVSLTRAKGDVVCDVTLDGDIEQGDLRRIQDVIRGLRKVDRTICLSSDGGSFAEGLNIAKYLIEDGIGTVIEPAKQCFSACAIIFMAGTEEQEGFKTRNRKLHPTGILGFHAPYLRLPKQAYTQGEVEAAYSVGVVALAKLLALEPGPPHEEFFPKELIVELARHGPNEAFIVKTVRDVIRLKIDLYGLAEPTQISKNMACNACGNSNELAPFGGCVAEDKINVTRKHESTEFSVSVPGAEGNEQICVLSVGRMGSAVGVANGPLTLSVSISETKTDNIGLWHLYPPNTPIKSLPIGR
jgi:hypothetical protein